MRDTPTVYALVRFVQYARSKNRLRGYELLPSAQHSIMNGWTIRRQEVCSLFQGTALAVLQMCEKKRAELNATCTVAMIRPFYSTCFTGFRALPTRSGRFCRLIGLPVSTGIYRRGLPNKSLIIHSRRLSIRQRTSRQTVPRRKSWQNCTSRDVSIPSRRAECHSSKHLF
jgi:hypothetical protein